MSSLFFGPDRSGPRTRSCRNKSELEMRPGRSLSCGTTSAGGLWRRRHRLGIIRRLTCERASLGGVRKHQRKAPHASEILCTPSVRCADAHHQTPQHCRSMTAGRQSRRSCRGCKKSTTVPAAALVASATLEMLGAAPRLEVPSARLRLASQLLRPRHAGVASSRENRLVTVSGPAGGQNIHPHTQSAGPNTMDKPQ